jgi:hypothetical protein
MATPTPYSNVFEMFLFKVSEYKLMAMLLPDRETQLTMFLRTAIVQFQHTCKIDLKDRDETLKQFNQELDDEIIDILSEGMIPCLLKQYLYNTDNYESSLSTKDVKKIFPSLKEIRETYKYSQSECERLIKKYSFDHGDISELHQ